MTLWDSTSESGGPPWQRVQSFCAQLIASDLQGRPLYVVDGGELPGDVQPRGCLGYHSTALDLQLLDWLESRGRWSGRGVAIVATPLDSAPDEVQGLLGVTLHELAHALCTNAADSARWTRPVKPELASRERLAAWLAEPRCRQTSDEVRSGHGPAFLRVLVHLVCRAREFGSPICYDDVLQHGLYQYSALAHYGAAMIGEPRRWLGRKLSDLLGLLEPLPRAFAELWAHDTGETLCDRLVAPDPERAAGSRPGGGYPPFRYSDGGVRPFGIY